MVELALDVCRWLAHLFVHAEGVLGLVDDAAASAAVGLLVLLAGDGVAELLGCALVALWLGVAGMDVSTELSVKSVGFH